MSPKSDNDSGNTGCNLFRKLSEACLSKYESHRNSKCLFEWCGYLVPNRRVNVDITTRNFFTPLNKVRVCVSLHGFSRNSEIRIQTAWKFSTPNIIQMWQQMWKPLTIAHLRPSVMHGCHCTDCDCLIDMEIYYREYTQIGRYIWNGRKAIDLSPKVSFSPTVLIFTKLAANWTSHLQNFMLIGKYMGNIQVEIRLHP
jgi:hypothetical protein